MDGLYIRPLHASATGTASTAGAATLVVVVVVVVVVRLRNPAAPKSSQYDLHSACAPTKIGTRRGEQCQRDEGGKAV